MFVVAFLVSSDWLFSLGACGVALYLASEFLFLCVPTDRRAPFRRK